MSLHMRSVGGQSAASMLGGERVNGVKTVAYRLIIRWAASG